MGDPGPAAPAGTQAVAHQGDERAVPAQRPLPHRHRARPAPGHERGGRAGGPGVGQRLLGGLPRRAGRGRGRLAGGGGHARHLRRVARGRGVPRVAQAPAGTASPAREAHPAPALFRQHDPVADRRGAGHLPDARVPAPRPYPRPAAPGPARRGVTGAQPPSSRPPAGLSTSPNARPATTSTATPTGVRPDWVRLNPTGSASSWATTAGARAHRRRRRSPHAAATSPSPNATNSTAPGTAYPTRAPRSALSASATPAPTSTAPSRPMSRAATRRGAGTSTAARVTGPARL